MKTIREEANLTRRKLLTSHTVIVQQNDAGGCLLKVSLELAPVLRLIGKCNGHLSYTPGETERERFISCLSHTHSLYLYMALVVLCVWCGVVSLCLSTCVSGGTDISGAIRSSSCRNDLAQNEAVEERSEIAKAARSQ